MRTKGLLTAGAALTVLAQSEAAIAQDVAAPADEIIVTAERANRTLRETASSVAVTTADDTRRLAGAYTTNDLLARIPNLVLVEPGNDAPAVRGLDGTGPAAGATAFLAGTRPRLNYQVDGRTLSFNETLFGNASLWDMQQIEVYRGPQRTLQGRNAIAGVVAIKTADPTFAWEGAARGIVGNRDEHQLSGAVSGPIVQDVAAFRVTGDWRRSQSYATFSAYPGTSNPGLSDLKTFRGKLLLTPSPDIRSLWTLSYQDGREPQAVVLRRPFRDHVAQTLPMPVFRSRTTMGISDTVFELSDSVSLQAYFSAVDFRVDRYAPAGTGAARIDGREYVAQPMLRYRSADDRLSGFVAGYIFRTDQDETIDLFGGGGFRDETDTSAIFGEITFKPAPAVTLVAGARYEEEKRYRSGAAGPFAIAFDETYREFLPKATLSVNASDKVTLGVTAGRGYNAGGAGITFAAPYVNYTYDPEFVWNYEAFVRATVASNISVNANLFYNDYDGLQLPFQLSALSTVIGNAQEARTYGAELEVAWRPSAKNQVWASFGALNTKLTRYSGQPIEGNELPRAPAFNMAAGFTFSPDQRFELGADVRYTDAYYSDVFNNARGKTDPYAVVNGQVAYDLGPARVFFAVRNLLDSGAAVQILPGATTAADAATIIEPRKISAGVELRF
jgi:iron complex outermembrane recepter protein